MLISFVVLEHGTWITSPVKNTMYLRPSNWDDYSFKTSFEATLYDIHGVKHDLGVVKIGYKDQSKGWSLQLLPRTFTQLPDGWFSLGQDAQYYRTLKECLDQESRLDLLRALKDIVTSEGILEYAQNERVFKDSLMRGVSLATIHGQFKRLAHGQAELTEFDFKYIDPGDERNAQIKLDFEVTPLSKPSTNIHILIGRNGVGKTTLLNNIITAIISPHSQPRGKFYTSNPWGVTEPLGANYFSSVVSVSFSAFDPFIPPKEQPDRSKGVAYFYVGMKKHRAGEAALPPKSEDDLINDFIDSLKSCFSQVSKKIRWCNAISRLESDRNFADMDLKGLINLAPLELSSPPEKKCH